MSKMVSSKHRPDAEKTMENIRVVFVEPEIEGNVGFLARAMKNFGLKELYLVAPKIQVADTARAFAMHANEILDHAVYVKSLDEAVRGVNLTVGTTAITAKRGLNIKRNAIEVQEFVENIVPNHKVALVFGRESSGLRNTEVDACDFVLTVPTSPSYPTMNVTHAATIVFYEIYKKVMSSGQKPIPRADRKKKEILVNYFSRMLNEAEVPSHKKDLALRSFRNLIGRSFISSREATVLMGAYRRALRKIRSREKTCKEGSQKRTSLSSS